MSSGWSPGDKAVVKSVFSKAKSRAENETLKLYKNTTINSIKDLWSLEQMIRGWRKEIYGKFNVNYSTAEKSIAAFVKKGWLRLNDLQSLSEERLERIKRNI